MNQSRFNSVVSAIRALPQSEHIPDIRIPAWANKVQALDDGKSFQFHLDRLGFVGGSESGSILAHYHDTASSAKLEDGFKSADAISREKLLLAYPFSTPYAERGTRVEPVIRDLFCRKYNLFDKVDTEAEAAARFHAKNSFMASNTDNVFQDRKRILVDYKSFSPRSHTSKIPFTHVSQLNHYAENMRSNNYAPDICLTANLIAEESVFQDIIKAYEDRESNPGDYEFWMNAILSEKLSSCRLVVKNVETSPEFGKLTSETITRFMNEYPISGKTISSSLEKTVLIGNEKTRAAEIEAKIFSLMTAEKALAEVKAAIAPEVAVFSNEIGKPFDWPGLFPIAIDVKPEFDRLAALEAVQLSGIDIDRLYIPSSRGDIDLSKLLEKFEALGGKIDSSIFQTNLDVERLMQAMNDAGLSLNDFQTSVQPSIRMSRKMVNADQKDALHLEVLESLTILIEEKAQEELMQIEELQTNHSSNNSFSLSN